MVEEEDGDFAASGEVEGKGKGMQAAGWMKGVEWRGLGAAGWGAGEVARFLVEVDGVDSGGRTVGAGGWNWQIGWMTVGEQGGC